MNNLDNRFWNKVNKFGPVPSTRPELGPCWLWVAYRHPSGYGWFGTSNGPRGAHIVAYEALAGSIPNGLELDHLCRVRGCVNPSHLEAVTRKVNIKRGVEAGTFGKGNRKKTHCPKGHTYTLENTIIYNGWRRCRTCKRDMDRRRHVTSGVCSKFIKTHCPHGHPYSGRNLLIYAGYRRCRTCLRKQAREAMRRKRHLCTTVSRPAA